MAKLICLLGLAGSGKTHYAEKLVASAGARYFDGVIHHGHLPLILSYLSKGDDCVIEEIQYCDSLSRNELVKYVRTQARDVEIEFVCFENDLESANWNVIHRKNKGDANGHILINLQWHARYSYPEGVVAIPIFRIRVD